MMHENAIACLVWHRADLVTVVKSVRDERQRVCISAVVLAKHQCSVRSHLCYQLPLTIMDSLESRLSAVGPRMPCRSRAHQPSLRRVGVVLGIIVTLSTKPPDHIAVSWQI